VELGVIQDKRVAAQQIVHECSRFITCDHISTVFRPIVRPHSFMNAQRYSYRNSSVGRSHRLLVLSQRLNNHRNSCTARQHRYLTHIAVTTGSRMRRRIAALAYSTYSWAQGLWKWNCYRSQ